MSLARMKAMKFNEKALKEQLKAQCGVGGLKQAQSYADQFATLLTNKISSALGAHDIDLETRASHDDGSIKGNMITFQIYLDGDEFIRPSMSEHKEYDDANMLYLFDVGWNMPDGKRIVEHGTFSRTQYGGEHYIREACDEFNHSTPSGVTATPSSDFM